MYSQDTIGHLKYCLGSLTPKLLICGVSGVSWLNSISGTRSSLENPRMTKCPVSLRWLTFLNRMCMTSLREELSFSQKPLKQGNMSLLC